jgi:hypothetical protein
MGKRQRRRERLRARVNVASPAPAKDEAARIAADARDYPEPPEDESPDGCAICAGTHDPAGHGWEDSQACEICRLHYAEPPA